METLRITTHVGREVAPHLRALARLRIEVFRAYPYLYDGTLAYEEQYLAAYSASPESLFVIVWDGDEAVGASTGLPLHQADEAFQAPLREAGYRVEHVFYCGESVLRPAYRGRGLGRRFFEVREEYARDLGCRLVAFSAVERPPDHPRRPAGYRPLDAFWQRLGYAKHPELHARYAWKEVGEEQESPKRMVFWLKALT